jgi:hypothetical protein
MQPKGKEETMKELNIKQIMGELESGNYNYYGLRNATEHDLELINSGRTYLDCSHNWVDNEDTEEKLEGSCAVYVSEYMSAKEITARYNQVLNNYFGNTILLIADNTSEWGNDENEIVLGNGWGADIIGIVRL